MAEETEVNVGGTYYPIDNAEVKVAGVWKQVSIIKTRVSGVWKTVWTNLTLRATGSIGASLHTNGTAVTVGVKFNRDGTFNRKSEGSDAADQDWMLGTTVPTDVGDDYETKATYTGDTALQPVLADDTWRDLSTTISYVKTAAPGDFWNGTLTVTVRETANTSNTETYTLAMATEDGS